MAHDWGGAVGWSWPRSTPELLRPAGDHQFAAPGTFLRELRDNPAQQAASAYMNFLCRPDAEALLASDDYRAPVAVLHAWAGRRRGWLTDAVRDAVPRGVDARPDRRLQLLPRLAAEAGRCQATRRADVRHLPREMLAVRRRRPWCSGRMDDVALLPGLLDGLEEYVPRLELKKVPGATHWIIHEQPQLVAQRDRGVPARAQ